MSEMKIENDESPIWNSHQQQQPMVSDFGGVLSPKRENFSLSVKRYASLKSQLSPALSKEAQVFLKKAESAEEYSCSLFQQSQSSSSQSFSSHINQWDWLNDKSNHHSQNRQQQKKQACERFIPSRKYSKMQVSFNQQQPQLAAKDSHNSNDNYINNQEDESSPSIASLYERHVLSLNENSRVLSFSNQKNNILAGMSSNNINNNSNANNMFMEQQFYDENTFPCENALKQSIKPRKNKQLVFTESAKVLDAPGLEDDYYLNLLHWSAQNVISIVLKNEVFGYNYTTRKIFSLHKADKFCNVKFTSVKFSKSGRLLAIGDSLGGVQVIDAETQSEVAFFQNHEDRVASLSWISDDILASGSKDRNILCHDIRQKDVFRKYEGHKNEVCGLEWSPDQQTLASGGNDDKLFIWNIGYNSYQYKFSQHKAAVKAIAWSPHQHGLLASGGGSRDKTIRFWNVNSGKELDCIETNSQVCSLAFSQNANMFVSTHGFAENEIYVWKYPQPQKVKIFKGHQQRVIYMALSPDHRQIVTGASDETLRFWDAFPGQNSHCKENESVLKFNDLR